MRRQAADELGGNQLGGQGEEGFGEVLTGRGGYGSGSVRVCLGVLTPLVEGANLEAHTPLSAMSAEQLLAFWAAVEADASLQEKLSASTDGEIDTPLEAAAVVAIAKDAGFIITVADLLRADAEAILELSDEELEKVAGGTGQHWTMEGADAKRQAFIK